MNEIMKNQESSWLPRNFTELKDYAQLIANSDFCPRDFKNKTGSVIIAIQMGHEVGLKPIQALQNIAVINGRPAIWGDATLAIVRAHPDFERIQEEVTDNYAKCTGNRKNEPEHIVIFTVEDAKKAGLWGKAGPWTNYPKRMLQMRARAFWCRDVFPDALKGLSVREEVEDFEDQKEIKPISETKNPALNSIEKFESDSIAGEMKEEAPFLDEPQSEMIPPTEYEESIDQKKPQFDEDEVVTVKALVDYEERDHAKSFGFRFDASKKSWIKKIPFAAVEMLPFEYEIISH